MKKLIVCALMVLALGQSFLDAATFDKRIHLQSTDYTDVRIRWVREYTTLIDSVDVDISALGYKDTILTLDDLYNWDLEFMWTNATNDTFTNHASAVTRNNQVLASAQTFSMTGNITGNLSGSVGSVTGNVGGNVVGSVGSVAGNVSGSVNSVTTGVTLQDDAITANKIAASAINASEAPNLDAAISTRSTFAAATDSVLVRMGAFNSALDNDTTLVAYLRAILSTISAGSEVWTAAQRDSIINRVLAMRDSVNLVHAEVVNTNGWTPPTFPTNFADLSITAGTGRVTVGTNADKTGYSLVQNFPANFGDLAITASTGRVTVGTNADKTGYSLTQTFPTNFSDLSITASTGYVAVGSLGPGVATTIGDTAAFQVAEEDTVGHQAEISDPTKMPYYYSQTGASTGADSGVVARVVKRTVWGIATGSGGDSTTIAQRKVADVTVGTNNDKTGYTASLEAGEYTEIKDTINEALDNDSTVLQLLRLAAAGGVADEVWLRPEVDTLIARLLALRDSMNLVHAEVGNLNGWSPPTFPTNFSLFSIDGSGRVTVASNADKSGYSLSQSFPTNFSDLAITASTGRTTAQLAPGEYTEIKDTLDQTLDNDTTLVAFLRLAVEGGSGGEVWLRPEVDTLIARLLAIRDSINLIHAEVVNVDGVVPLTPSDTGALAANITNRMHDADTVGHQDNLGDPSKMAYYYSRIGAGGGGGSSCGDSLGYTRTIVVIDTSAAPDEVVPQMAIYFNNQAQSADPYMVTTDNLGRAALGLNAGNWVRLHADPRYLPETDSFTVSGVGVDTMRFCAAIVVDSDTLTSTVAFLLKKPDGTANDSLAVTVELLAAHPDSLLRINNSLIAASFEQMRFRGDANGLALVNLYPNQLFTNDSSCYRATIKNRFNDKIVEVQKFRVPVSDSVVYYQNLPRWKNR